MMKRGSANKYKQGYFKQTKPNRNILDAVRDEKGELNTRRYLNKRDISNEVLAI